MRTSWGVAVVMSIAVASLMFTGSGYGEAFSNNPTDGLGGVGSEVNEQADESAVEQTGDDGGGPLAGALGSTDNPLISFILSGGGAILSTIRLVVSLPTVLIGLGFPGWFALPVGAFVSIATSIGIIQFITGRVYR
jgi:hypothetical protein